MTNRVKETNMYAAITYSQISMANGFRKLNRRVGWDVGTWNKTIIYWIVFVIEHVGAIKSTSGAISRVCHELLAWFCGWPIASSHALGREATASDEIFSLLRIRLLQLWFVVTCWWLMISEQADCLDCAVWIWTIAVERRTAVRVPHCYPVVFQIHLKYRAVFPNNIQYFFWENTLPRKPYVKRPNSYNRKSVFN